MNILEQNNTRHRVFQYEQVQNRIVTQAGEIRWHSPAIDRGKPDIKTGMKFASYEEKA